jgi:hypothetical protein
MPRKRELWARRHKKECLAAEEAEKKAEMRASILRNETPEERAEREEREYKFEKETWRTPYAGVSRTAGAPILEQAR